MMNMPQEAVGAVPQPGVNPQARPAPAPQQPPPAQAQPPQGGHALSPQDLNFLRTDPEIAAAVAQVMGRQIDLAVVPDELLAVIAGMVHKLGVEGAVAEFQRSVPPELIQQIRSAA